MIYELTYGGYRLGTFPTEAEAVRRAGYLPKGRYTVREWEKDGEFSTFDPSMNKCYCFTNKYNFNAMDYNRQTIANEIASFKYTMKQTNDDISPAEIIDGLMQWVEQYTNVLHEISVAETLDDLKELKQNAACPDIRPDVAIWALRRIVRVIMAADCLYQRLCRES